VCLENKYVRPAVNDLKSSTSGRESPGIENSRNGPILPMMFVSIIPINRSSSLRSNMSGKSALLRQTALIVLMTQMVATGGGYRLCDDLSPGWGLITSHGRVHLHGGNDETASILNNLSERSLILLDEIAGHQHHDGISIAGLVEFLHEHPRFRPKLCLLTHYHELNAMENSFERVKITASQGTGRQGDLPAQTDPRRQEHSFGIHVARMAGMPRSLVNRAGEVLGELEVSHNDRGPSRPVAGLADKREGLQLSFFQLDDPVLKQIRDEIARADITTLLPWKRTNSMILKR
jgi:DNA mismatch repair protein MutS